MLAPVAALLSAVTHKAAELAPSVEESVSSLPPRGSRHLPLSRRTHVRLHKVSRPDASSSPTGVRLRGPHWSQLHTQGTDTHWAEDTEFSSLWNKDPAM